MNNDINNPKLLYPLDTLKISEDVFVKIGLYEKRGNKFYDVFLNINDEEVFLGRFIKKFNKLKAKYNKGKILLYYDEFNENTKNMQIIEVLSLYEIIDDTFYSCTEEEALGIFDKNIDTRYLKNKHKPIYRADIEKKKRLK